MTTTAPHMTERLTAIAAPLVESLGLQIWGLEFIPGGRSVVRLYIEGPDGATIDQCADVSRLFGLSLEVEDVIDGAYVLEVSSPGLERVFFTPAQLEPYAGSEDFFELALRDAKAEHPGRKNFTGRIAAAADGLFTFLPCEPDSAAENDGGEGAFSFAWDDARKIRRIHFVPAPGKPKKGNKPAKAGSAKNEKTPRAATPTGAPSTDSGGSE